MGGLSLSYYHYFPVSRSLLLSEDPKPLTEACHKWIPIHFFEAKFLKEEMILAEE